MPGARVLAISKGKESMQVSVVLLLWMHLKQVDLQWDSIYESLRSLSHILSLSVKSEPLSTINQV